METGMNGFFVSAFVQLVVFGLLGSCLWTCTGLALFAIVFWHSDLSSDTLHEMGPIFLSVLPYVAVYALGVGLFDFILGWLQMPYRVVICAVAAAGSVIWMSATMGGPTKVVCLSLIAALPAALCSWLSSSFANRRPPQADLLLAPPASTASPG